MKRKQFSEEQIIKVLAEGEAGATGKEVCRRHGISEQTFYRWKSKYGGMTVSEAKRLRELEAENRKLKQLLGEAHLDCILYLGTCSRDIWKTRKIRVFVTA